jgi:hypothetical protein
MDLEAVKDWYRQGLVRKDDPVLTPRGKRWIPLRQAIPLLQQETSSAASRAAPSTELRAAVRAATRGGTRRAGQAVSRRTEPDETQPWRTIVGGVLLLLTAAGSAFWAFYPDRWIASLDAVPWQEVALGQAALGLALLPGWELTRKLVRLILGLTVCALLPAVGILVAQRTPWLGLVVVASAFVLLLGLIAWLAKGRLSVARITPALLVFLSGVAGIVRFGLVPESPEAKQVRQWASDERSLGDPTGGLWLSLPEPWVVLDARQDLVPTSEGTRQVLAQPRLGGFGILSADLPRRILSEEEFLNQVLSQRNLPGRVEQGRADVPLGRLLGRKVESVWEREGKRYRDLMVVAKDGLTYWLLTAWMPDDGSDRPAAELDALAGGLSFEGKMAAQLEGTIQAVREASPFLSAASAEAVIASSGKRDLEPRGAFRHAMELVTRGRPSLGPGEAADLERLDVAIERQMPRDDGRRWRLYVSRIREGSGTNPEDDRAMASLVRDAVLKLPSGYLGRLQDLCEKAVAAALREGA